MPREAPETPVTEAPRELSLMGRRTWWALKSIVEKATSPEERVAALDKKFLPLKKPLIENAVLPEDTFDAAYSALCTSMKDDLVDLVAAVKTLEPIVTGLQNFEKTNPKIFPKIRRDIYAQTTEYHRINEIVFYGIDNGELHLHLAPSYDIPSFGLLKHFQDASHKLVSVLKENMSVKIISLTSWIVANKSVQLVLTQSGFSIQLMDNKDNDAPPEARATISREDFLKNFAHKNI